jgi:ATP-dependent DNA helicase DinG
LPSAVIAVKQAVGRLIRTSTDKGIVVLADKRLISKYYGKKFLNSLPTNNIVSLTMDEIIEEIEAEA